MSTDILTTLTTELAEFRTAESAKRSNPIKAELRALEAEFAPVRDAYYTKRQAILERLEAYREEHPTKPGRPKRAPFPDSLALAAHRASTEYNKGVVRAMLGLTGGNNAATLNALLAQGKALHEAEVGQ